ncbi:MAG TPA: TonB-dependent receptor [Kofleriaceae bacterium]|jgi:hypothetical protein
MRILTRSCLALATLLAISPLAQAQDPPSDAQPAEIEVSGRVIDALGRPVAGATVTVENATEHVTTDKAGRYKTIAAVGATLVVLAEGKSTELATVTGPTLEDVVLLLDTPGEQIQVHGETPVAAPGAATLGREEVQRLPGTGGDIVRALTAMPSVVNLQVPLGFSGVVIRGSSPQDSKFLVDDFEIPLLFHALGFRAILPVESIQSMTLVPGGFDVSYGRASSGIVQLTTRPGSEKQSTQAEVSIVDGGLITQGSIGKKTKYLIALRRSLIDFILPHVIPSSVDLSLTTVPQYWDEQLRIDHELSSHWNLTLSSVGTDDVFELYTTKDENAGAKRFYSRQRFIRVTGAAKYHNGEWTGTLALSGMLSDLDVDVGLYQHLGVVTPLLTPRATLTRSLASAMGLKNFVWTSGAEAQIGYSSVDIALPLDKREGQPLPAYDPKDNSTHFKGSVWFPDFAAWTSVAADFDPRVRVTTGVRADYFGRPEQLAVQPRSELKITISDKLTSRSSAGEYLRPPEYNTELLAKSLQAEQAQQLTTGLEYSPILGVRVQGTAYFTDRTHLITQAADGTLGNTGRGSSKGLELLTMIHGGTWFGWLGYSYSHSTRVDVPGGPSRLFDYDQPHNFNLAGSWKHGHWQFGARFQLYSGLPYTPVVSAIYDNDRNLYIPTYGAVNSERAPIHHEVDLRIDYAWKWGPAQMLAFLDVQNVYLNESVVTYFYGYDYTQRSAFVSLPLIPSAGLRAVL